MNIISFDVEEWFQVGTFINNISSSSWNKFDQRVSIGLDFILETLNNNGVKGVFFIVGWVAEKNTNLVRRILKNGHQIGLHSYAHKPITQQSRTVFTEDLKKGIDALETIINQPVELYRAPSYTITGDTLWAVDILYEHGITVDSSIYPITGHPTYGIYGAPTEPFRFENGLYEFPISTFKLFNHSIPFASGAYFRFLPYIITSRILQKENSNDFFKTLNYHPWEFDEAHKKIINLDVPNISILQKIRHTFNVDKNKDKLSQLLTDFEFSTFDNYINKNDFPVYQINASKLVKL